MNYIYIPTIDLNTAILTSEKLYNLSRPETIKDPNDLSKYYCSWLIHPTTNAVVLEIPELDTVPINIQAKETELNEVLQPAVNLGFISLEEFNSVKQSISNSKGQLVNLLQFVPLFWINQIKTREQLQTEGWFSNEII